ncbi:MAG: hypothetical protein R2824_27070 [Saprospiraceae bacterium]|nr:hypothetical protein [Lewinella sp.]
MKTKVRKKRKIRKDPTLRKNFYRRLAYIVLGVAAIWLLADQSSSLRLVGVAFLIIIVVQLLWIVSSSPKIIDDFFPSRVKYEGKARPFDRFIYYLPLTVMFSGLIFELFQIRKIDNTIDGMGLFWMAGAIGLLFALLLALFLEIKAPSVFDESERRSSVLFGFFLGFFLLTPAIANFINQYDIASEEVCTNYQIAGKSTSASKSRSCWLFVKIGRDNEERFEVNRSLYDQVEAGGLVQLCTKKGRLGYEFVTQFKTENE